MLEPRKSDIPALFLVLVVLPVVLYILLGIWSESAKRKGRINLIVEEGFGESFKVEPMATTTASAVPFIVPPTIAPVRECARCHGPATTRCSRCKSVRYCSGKCQIIHWRQGHKEECQSPDYVDSYSRNASFEEAGSRRDFGHGHDAECHGYSSERHMHEKTQFNVELHAVNPGATFADTSPCSGSHDSREVSKPERRISERKTSRKSTKETPDNENRAATDANLKEANARQKPRVNRPTTSENSYPEMHDMNGSGRRYESQSTHGIRSQNGDSLLSAKRGMNEVGVGLDYGVHAREVSSHSEEGSWRNSLPHMHSSNGSKNAVNVESVRLSIAPKSMTKAGREQVHPAKLRKGNGCNGSGAGMGTSTSTHETDGATSIGLMKSMGLEKLTKMSKKDVGLGIHGLKKAKVLFPFEDFIRFFEREVFDLAPRGLQNCGNSCYANAVLQCLTCTKPLVAYLLSRMHSRACCRKNWCLICELEQHVMMLKEAGGPLSPSRILSHMRGINCQIGDGSQEDAHEFLRLLVTSMQSICLEEVGGESQVHPFLQETTFVQQTFGGRLRSKVLCLRCYHESERHENIMDLTLEIYGWVESLEDALTQFTTPEDLDGENMYRCARCASYVRARKQLSIDEAPNILTIVLKRFQEGSYGKINKCITFPEMLDMVPFMTGTNDIPPRYMLYGVVVHVDTLNASFSGHYVSYVKDLQGNWFRIDDSVVQPVPTSQVMSEGAYILFYMRTFPRLPRVYISKATKNHASMACGQNSHRANRCTRSVETYTDPSVMEFSDATSSDWSLFTSSDDASFTSESTRDSFGTTDYSDTCHVDPSTSSMFSTRFARDRPSQRTVSCRMFSGSEPVTRYISEQTGYILDSDNSNNPLDEIYRGGNTRQVSVPFNQAYLRPDNGYLNFVNYESSSDSYIRTFSDFHI